MKKILTLLFLLVAVNVQAATYWVTGSGSDANGCNASGAPLTTTAKLTPSGALTCLTAGDTLYVRTGSYAGINTNTHAIASGTSWTNAVTIAAYPGDSVTLLISSSGNENLNLVSPTLKYVIFKDFIIDGENPTHTVGLAPAGGISFQNTISFIKLENLTHIGNTSNSCVGLNDQRTNNIWITGGEYYNCGSYGFYIEAPNNIVENLTIHDTGKNGNPITTYQVHSFTGYSPYTGPSRNIYRNLKIYNGGGILVWRGSQNQVYNNVIYDSNTCIDSSDPSSLAFDNVFYNNTCYNPTTYAWNLSGSVRAIVKNNIHWGGSSTSFNLGSATITQSHNACYVSGCTGTGASNGVNPNLTAPASGDFTLTSGSPMIDTGVASIGPCPAPLNCSYSTASNGASRDKGAFESIPFASGVAIDASTVDIQFGTAYAPISAVTTCTGFTLRQGAATKTLSTCTTPAGTNGIVQLTCAACLTAGADTIDFTITAAKFTDSINVGNTLNQPNFAITTPQTVTNTISGAAYVLTSRVFRQRTVGRSTADTVGAAWLKGENLAGTVRVDGGKFSNWWQIDCTTADCPSVGFQFEFNKNGGAYATATDSCATNAICYDSTNSAAPHGATISTCPLTNTLGNCLAGAVAAQASSYPVVDLALNQAVSIQANFAIQSGLVAGTDIICVRPKLDSGVAVTHAQTACFAVVNPAGSPS